MESRTTTFVKPDDPIQQDKIASGHTYDLNKDGGTTAIINATPYGEVTTSPVKVIFATTNQVNKSLLTFFVTIFYEQKTLTTQIDFSYKSSVRQSAVYPWIEATKSRLETLAQENGVDPAVVKICFQMSLYLLWEGIRQGVAKKHEKKSLAKDKLDSADLNDLFGYG